MRIGLELGGDLFWTQIERLDIKIPSVELLNVLMRFYEQIFITF